MVKLNRNNQTDKDLGTVDLSDTVSVLTNDETKDTTSEVENKPVESYTPTTEVSTLETEQDNIDLSETEKLDVIIQEPIIIHKRSKWIIPVVVLVLVCLITTLFVYLNIPKQNTDTTPTVVNTTPIENQNSVKTFTSELKRTADETGTPYKISTETIGGNYVLGITTYNPDNPKDLYMDYELLKPDKPEEQVSDDRAKEIQEKLQSESPKINKSIIVKDKNKVSMETYKMNDEYQTILLYDGKPFGYVSTDKDGVSTNYVTSYYVTDVASE